MDIKQSAEFISQNSAFVKINHSAIDACAEYIASQMQVVEYSTATWSQHPLHPRSMGPQEICDWIFMMDLLNFSFWHEKSSLLPYTVSFNGTAYTGYWSLCAAMKKMDAKGIPITSPAYYANATDAELAAFFAPDNPEFHAQIPLFQTRCEMLRKAGKILLENCDGHFSNLIKQANKSSQRLLELIMSTFGDLFHDSAMYKGKQVFFHKRAQILIADMWACFENTGLGEFLDIDTITMFADYRVPQALVHLKVIEYTTELLNLLDLNLEYHKVKATPILHENERHMLAYGDPREVEIRGASIWVVEMILKAMRERNPDMVVNAIMIDFYLWDFAKKSAHLMSHIPIHLTRSIYY